MNYDPVEEQDEDDLGTYNESPDDDSDDSDDRSDNEMTEVCGRL